MFDFNTVNDFDKHISLSIPNYQFVIDTILSFSDYFIEDNSNIYDVGCSTGSFLQALNARTEHKNIKLIGIDNSDLIPDKDDNSDLIPDKDKNIEFIKKDLGSFNDFSNASLITSIFTLQFLPKNLRYTVINKIKMALNTGGAFILTEKVYSDNGRLQDILNSIYYEFKNKEFTGDEILQKERELRSNMHIKNINSVLSELQSIGRPEIFWKSYNFVGIIVIKEN